MYRTILLGTDGSTSSRRATTVAATLAGGMGAKVIVAASAVEHGSPAMPWSDEWREQPVDPEVAEGWARVEQAWLTEQGIEAETMVLEGHAADALAKAATRETADLIIVGLHGRSVGQGITVGSVTEELLRLVTCPVVIVP